MSITNNEQLSLGFSIDTKPVETAKRQPSRKTNSLPIFIEQELDLRYPNSKEVITNLYNKDCQILVGNICYRFSRKLRNISYMDYDELKSVAEVAVVKALTWYDVKKKASVKSWLYSKVTFAIQDYLRSLSTLTRKQRDAGKKEYVVEAVEPTSELLDSLHSDNPSSDYEKEEKKKLVLDSLSHLTEQQREVIILRFLQGYQQEAIANKLGITRQKVAIIISIGLAEMRKVLEPIIY